MKNRKRVEEDCRVFIHEPWQTRLLVWQRPLVVRRRPGYQGMPLAALTGRRRLARWCASCMARYLSTGIDDGCTPTT
ncbi:hypothetical protein IF1G_01593 [Cordyceps javanica]|uniref:Uncharacterized protein n=1 Tax=Cordyceps javanica TaxID=43265 RepID=A0A545VCC8_9HYPO|nr:hypothetical protein IF1G_01593 [Cordyceps javanica]